MDCDDCNSELQVVTTPCQGSSASANRHKRAPSGKAKHKAEPTRQLLGASSGSGLIVRSSPYVRRTAKEGSKQTACGISPPSSVTHQVPFCSANFTQPKTETRSLGETPKLATTFVRSVLNLRSNSTASCSDISEPVPCEDMFLDLVSLCGLAEAKYWAEVMGFEYQTSYALL